MIFGEHLSAEEVPIKCPCGETATVEVLDGSKQSHGWFCRRHAWRMRRDLRRQEKIAKAIVRRIP